MNGGVSSRLTRATAITGAIVAGVAFIVVFGLGVLVPDATNPAAYGTSASLVWGVAALVMLAAIVVSLLAVAKLWAAKPGEEGWAWWTCGLASYGLTASALALYLFGTGIAVTNRQPAIDLLMTLCAVTGPLALLGAGVVGLGQVFSAPSD